MTPMCRVRPSSRARTAALRAFVPDARPGDWELVTAGQRVQVLKMTDARRGAMVGFGTELITSAGGSLTALLGASPGASTGVATMVDVLAAGFPARMAGWSTRLAEIAGDRSDVADLTARTDEARRILGLDQAGALGRDTA